MKEINLNRNKKAPWKLLLYILPGIMVLYLSSCITEYPVEPFFEGEDESITDYIQKNRDDFSSFEEALLSTDLLTTLSARNPNGNQYTLFLPNNEAVERFIEKSNQYNSLKDLIADKNYLSSFVKYHIVNSGFQTNNFPFGALADTTISGQILNVGFSGSWDSTVFRINNQASIVQPNIQLINGYIHVIDDVLTPVVLNSYEWLDQNPEFSIFTEALNITGLKDTFVVNNNIIPNTLFIETDEVFQKNGIGSIDDLIREISPEDNNYSSSSNPLFQFVSYHILEGDLFLNDFEGTKTNFNTYAKYPLFINGEGLDILINPGSQIFDTIITDTDTTIVNSIGVDYEKSNILTKNGAIHRITQMMKLYRPKPSSRSFRFYEEDVIKQASTISRVYKFDETDKDKFEFISWSGIEELYYVKGSSNDANNDDYLRLNGDFEISYEIPKILPGEYNLQIRAQTTYASNATLTIFLDGRRVGGNLDLTRGPDKWGNEFLWLDVGTISFEEYESHTITVKSLITGTFYWDEVRFEL